MEIKITDHFEIYVNLKKNELNPGAISSRETRKPTAISNFYPSFHDGFFCIEEENGSELLTSQESILSIKINTIYKEPTK